MQDRVSSLQALRAFAAGGVLLEHALYRSSIASSMTPPNVTAIPYGSMGVGIFFVLSGLLMGQILMRGYDPLFIFRRILRIYPPFWAAAAISIIAFSALGLPTAVDLKAVLLLPARSYKETFNIPYWTLVYEMVFYVIVYVFMMLRLKKPTVEFLLVTWACAILLGFYYFGEPPHSTAGAMILFAPMNLLFIFGMLCGMNNLKAPQGVPTFVIWLAAAVVFAIGQSLSQARLAIIPLQGFAATLAVLATMRMKTVPRVLANLGDASYGLYLIHFIVLETTATIFSHAGIRMPFVITFPVMFLIALMVGWLFGECENRFHKFISTRALPRPRYALAS